MKQPDWTRIRGYWRHNEREILRAGASDWGVDPYAWDSDVGIEMTPIEAALWHDIRLVGVVLYPQWPIGRYFVDFASPAARVVIECDGARWHQDTDRDMQRQREIESFGWKVYRISGIDCLQDTKVGKDERERACITPSGAYELVKRIAEKHGIRFDGRRIKVAA